MTCEIHVMRQLLKRSASLRVALSRRAAPLSHPCRRGFQSSSSSQTDELFPQRMTLPEDLGYVPMLSPSQITSILVSNESKASFDKPNQGRQSVRWFDSNRLASNSPIEDRRAVGRLAQTGGQLFAVLDGHGGAACAQAISERLLEYLAVSLLPHDILAEYSHQMRTDNPMPLVEYHRFREDYHNEDLVHIYSQSLQKFVVETLSFSGLEEAPHTIIDNLKAAFLRLDADISAEAAPVAGAYDEDHLQIALSGSCACAVHVDGIDLHVSNVGDCRAVLGSMGADGQWGAKQISVDHNVDSEKESQRVRDSHPRGEAGHLFKNARLLGQLIPLRAFGDVRFKWSLADLKALAATMDPHSARNVIPNQYLTPPYLIARPQVTDFRLKKNDRFIIIGSDGLWELMTNERAVEIVGDHLIGMATRSEFSRDSYGRLKLGEVNTILRDRKRGLAYRTSDVNGATHIIRHALGFDHRKVSEMLTLPPAMSRFYRDDITVVIVYLDSGYLEKNALE